MDHILTRKNRKINRGPSTRVVRNGNNYTVLTPDQQFENTVNAIEENIPFIFYSITGAMLTINEIENLISDVLPPEALKLLEFNPLDIINYFVGPYGLEQFEDIDEELFSNFAKEHGMEVSMMSSIYNILSEEIPGLNISPRIKKLFGISTKTKTQGGSLFNKDHQRHSTKMSGGTFLGTLLSPLGKITKGVGKGLYGVAKRGVKLGPKDSPAFGAAIRWIVVILLFVAFSHQDRVNRFDLSAIFSSMLTYFTSFIFGTKPLLNMVPEAFAQHNEMLGPRPEVDMTAFEASKRAYEKYEAESNQEVMIKADVIAEANTFYEHTMKSKTLGLTSVEAQPIVQLLAPRNAVADMAKELEARTKEETNASSQNVMNARMAAASNEEWAKMSLLARSGALAASMAGIPWKSTSAAKVKADIEAAQQRTRIKEEVLRLAQASAPAINDLSSFNPQSMPTWVTYNFTAAIQQIKHEVDEVTNGCLLPSLPKAQSYLPRHSKGLILQQLSKEATSCSAAISAAHSKLSSNPVLAIPFTPESKTPYTNAFKSMNENNNSHAATSVNSSKLSSAQTLQLVAAEQEKLSVVVKALKERGIMLNMFKVLQKQASKKIGISNNDDTSVLQQHRVAIEAIFASAQIVSINIIENFASQTPSDVQNIIIPSLCRMALRSNSTYTAFIASNSPTQVYQNKGIRWPADSNSYVYLGKNYQEEFMIHFVSMKVFGDRVAEAATRYDRHKAEYEQLESQLEHFLKDKIKDKARRSLASGYEAYAEVSDGKIQPNKQCKQLVEFVFENQILYNGLWPRGNDMRALAAEINRYYTVQDVNGTFIIHSQIQNPDEWVPVQVASKWRKIRDADIGIKLEELMYSQIPLLLLFICTYLPADSLIKVLSGPLGLAADLTMLLRGWVQRWTPAPAQLRQNAAAPAQPRQNEINTNTAKLQRIEGTLRSHAQDRSSRSFFRASGELFSIIDSQQTDPRIRRGAQDLLDRYVPQSANAASAASASSSSASTNMSARINSPLLQLGPPVSALSPLRLSLLGQPVGQVSTMVEEDRMQPSSSSSASSSAEGLELPVVASPPPPPLMSVNSPAKGRKSAAASSATGRRVTRQSSAAVSTKPDTQSSQNRIQINADKLQDIESTIDNRKLSSNVVMKALDDLNTIIENEQSAPDTKFQARALLKRYQNSKSANAAASASMKPVTRPASAASASSSSASTNMSARINNPLLQLGLVSPSAAPPPSLLPAVSPSQSQNMLRRMLGPVNSHGLPDDVRLFDPNSNASANTPVVRSMINEARRRVQARQGQGKGGRHTKKRMYKKTRSTRKHHHRR